LVRLAAPIDGRITSIGVADGQVVHEGDTLAVISRDRVQIDGTSQHTEIRTKIDQERAVVAREIDNARLEAAQTRTMLARHIEGLRAERDTLALDVQSAEHLLGSLQAQGAQFDALAAKGFVSELQAAQKHDEIMAQESRVANARTAMARVRQEIDSSEAQPGLVESKLEATIADRSERAIELDRQATQSDADAEEIVRAPRDGTVFKSLIVSGQSVIAGQALFTIAPPDGTLVLRLLVPARAAAWVRSGTPIKMALEAYPEEEFGQFPAVIDTVSSAPARPEDIPHAGLTAGTVFISLASWAQPPHTPDGRPLWLKPGMQADAIVPLERRSMLHWLYAPMLRGTQGGDRTERAGGQGGAE
jgi:membrane fusion protein